MDAFEQFLRAVSRRIVDDNNFLVGRDCLYAREYVSDVTSLVVHRDHNGYSHDGLFVILGDRASVQPPRLRADRTTQSAPVSYLDDLSASENEVFAKENAW